MKKDFVQVAGVFEILEVCNIPCKVTVEEMLGMWPQVRYTGGLEITELNCIFLLLLYPAVCGAGDTKGKA